MSSSDSGQAPSAGVFDGLTFLVHGHQGKRTKAKMVGFIEQNGGSTTRHASSDYLSHLVCERDLFEQHTASTPDSVLREVLDTNEQKREDAGPDQKLQRVWILPPEWVEASVKNGGKPDEEKWDLARNADSVRASSGVGQGSSSSRKKDKSTGGKRKHSDADSGDKKPQVKKKRSEGTSSASHDVKNVKEEKQDKPKPGPRTSSSSSASTKTSSSKTTVDGVVPRAAPIVGGKPESKPVVSVNRTFIKPASQQQQQGNQKNKGMWGGIKRTMAKAPGARAPPGEPSGEGDKVKDVKGKGKARATEPENGASSDDDGLKKEMEKTADGAAFDDSGLSSLEEDD
ncbi:hypothetical protein JCM3775_001531 [Rhodotorula graminis]